MSRRALVTGGAGGIGAAIADALARDGAEVIVLDIDPDRLAAYSAATGRAGVAADVSVHDDVARAVGAVERAHGPIDILVNNAGIIRDAMLHKMDPADWTRVIAVNLGSVFNTARAIVPGMRQRGWGRIISLSSMNAQRGQAGQTNYAAAKAGIIGFTKSLALEVAGKGITVNCIAPGFIETDMTASIPNELRVEEIRRVPVGRAGQPEDIAGMAAFLASDAAAFVTGQVLAVNGGQYL
ncbi:MAG: 3-oxoacyl-ACP reductase FabG [Bauldia sp.]